MLFFRSSYIKKLGQIEQSQWEDTPRGNKMGFQYKGRHLQLKCMVKSRWAQTCTHHTACRSSSRKQSPLGSDRCRHRSAASYRLYPELPGPSRCPAGSFDKKTPAPPCCDNEQTHHPDPQWARRAAPPRAPQTHTGHCRRGSVCPRPLHFPRRLCRGPCRPQPPWEGSRSRRWSLPGRSAGTSRHSPPGRRCPALPRPCPSQWWSGWEGTRACPGRGRSRSCRGRGAKSTGGGCSSQRPPSGQNRSPRWAACPRRRCWPSRAPVSEEGTNAPCSPERRDSIKRLWTGLALILGDASANTHPHTHTHTHPHFQSVWVNQGDEWITLRLTEIASTCFSYKLRDRINENKISGVCVCVCGRWVMCVISIPPQIF